MLHSLFLISMLFSSPCFHSPMRLSMECFALCRVQQGRATHLFCTLRYAILNFINYFYAVSIKFIIAGTVKFVCKHYTLFQIKQP